MNEITPPSDPTPPLPAPVQPPSKKFCTFLGFLLFLFSGALSFVMPPICLLGLVGAIASLFFRGYRCIFLGYILTIGVLLLSIIIYCSNHPFSV